VPQDVKSNFRFVAKPVLSLLARYRHFKTIYRNCSLLPVGFCTAFVIHNTKKDNYTCQFIKWQRLTTSVDGHSIQTVWDFSLSIIRLRINCWFREEPKRANKIFAWNLNVLYSNLFKVTSQLHIAVSRKRTCIFTCNLCIQFIIIDYDLPQTVINISGKRHWFHLTGYVGILVYLYNTKYVYFAQRDESCLLY
jgi:hypothetical protein